jgi:phage gp46-like protein
MMADVRHEFDGTKLVAGWAFGNGGLAQDNGLGTSVIHSLFTDRIAEPSDEIPDGSTDRRGHWADGISGWKKGSRLWLLSREKATSGALPRAEGYAREALAWMLEDAVADRIDVEASLEPGGAAPIRDRLVLVVTIWKSGVAVFVGRYGVIWRDLAGAIGVRAADSPAIPTLDVLATEAGAAIRTETGQLIEVL